MATFKAFPVINMAATGANIQRCRKEKGLTITDLQTYFGFDAPQAIYKWQRGETLPSTDNLLALGYLLEVPIEKLLVFQTIEQSEPQDNSCGFDIFGNSDSPDLIFSYIEFLIHQTIQAIVADIISAVLNIKRYAEQIAFHTYSCFSQIDRTIPILSTLIIIQPDVLPAKQA